MTAQDAHAADPLRVTAEEVRAYARRFRSVVEADGRRTNADEEGSLMVSLIQRVDYTNQLLLALLNTQRAGVRAPSSRPVCALLILRHSSMPVLFLAGALAISPGNRPCVRFPLPLRLVLPVPLPLLLPLLWLLPVWPLLCLPLSPPLRLRLLRLLCLRLLAWPAPLVPVVPLVLGPPPPLRPPRVSGPRRRRRRRRRSSPRKVVLADLRVPVARRVRLERLRPECGLPLLWRCSVLLFSSSFPFLFSPCVLLAVS